MRRPQLSKHLQQPVIRPWFQYSGPDRYVVELYQVLIRLAMERSQLLPRQHITLLDLETAISNFEDRLLSLLDFRGWDLPRLRHRNHRIDKPRVDVFLEITRKGHLSLRWWPTGVRFRPREKIDFLAWGTGGVLGDHSSEILNLREFALIDIRDTRDHVSLAVDSLLVYAARALVERIAAFVGRFCDIHVVTAFRFTLDSRGHLSDWSIEDTAKEWIITMPERCGVSAVEFCRLMRGSKDRYGAAKALRQRGFKIDAKQVADLHAEFCHHAQRPEFRMNYPDLFDEPTCVRAGGNIIAFPVPERTVVMQKQEATPALARPAIPNRSGTRPRPTPQRGRVRDNPQLTPLKAWILRRFQDQVPDDKTVSRWIRDGQIVPPPQRRGKNYYVTQNAQFLGRWPTD